MSKEKGIIPVTSKNIEIKYDILTTSDQQNELRILKEVFQASYGPNGRTNFIQHASGGHVTVTSHSSEIIKSIANVSTPLTRLILQAVQGHFDQFQDGGLFTGLLTIQLIDASLKSGLPRHTAIAVNDYALDVILGHVNSSDFKIPADLGNVEYMLCVIRSTLGTKSASGMNHNELQSLSALLLRGFLNCIPKSKERNIYLDNLRIQECEGPSSSDSCLKEGILLEAKYQPHGKTIQESTNDIKVALFDCSLAGSIEDTWLEGTKTEVGYNLRTEDEVMLSMIEMIDKLVEDGVRLVACQKVIHPTLQEHITKKGVYVIERLSLCHIHAVQKLTGAKLLSAFHGNIQDSFGSLKKITALVISKRRFIHLIPHSNSPSAISTLLLCAPDEHGVFELKSLCSSVLQALKQLVHQPYLVPGAGCFETNIAGLLMKAAQDFDTKQELSCTKQQGSQGLHSVASTFLNIARMLDLNGNHHLIDTTTFHHWITRPMAIPNPQRCLCGLVTSTENTMWYMSEELHDRCSQHRYICVHKVTVEGIMEFKHVILDVASMKVNGIRTAFETANTILRVKHFVKENLS